MGLNEIIRSWVGDDLWNTVFNKPEGISQQLEGNAFNSTEGLSNPALVA